MVRRLDYDGPDPVWRLLAMTTVFGPIGKGWGAEQVDWRLTNNEAAVCLQAWWIDPETKRKVISHPHWGVAPISPNAMSAASDVALELAAREADLIMPFRMVPLSGGFVAFVDAEDYPAVSQYVWSASSRSGYRYAVRGEKIDGKNRMILMHRELMKPNDKEQVDHNDHNGLNNRRENLRICSNKQNSRNTRSRPGTSRFKGVCRTSNSGRWSAQITVDGKKKHLGVFSEEIEAADAYDLAAIENFGSFAYTNF